MKTINVARLIVVGLISLVLIIPIIALNYFKNGWVLDLLATMYIGATFAPMLIGFLILLFKYTFGSVNGDPLSHLWRNSKQIVFFGIVFPFFLWGVLLFWNSI